MGAFDSVGDFLFSPDGKQFVYAAGSQNKMSLFRDERPVAAGQSIGQVCFSPDSRRLGWVIGDGKRESLSLDGHAGREYDSVRDPHFSLASAFRHRE